jgi:ferredoxin
LACNQCITGCYTAPKAKGVELIEINVDERRRRSSLRRTSELLVHGAGFERTGLLLLPRIEWPTVDLARDVTDCVRCGAMQTFDQVVIPPNQAQL